MATKLDHARLAAAVNLLRPDWPTASLQTFLDRDHTHRPLPDLGVALVAVALDPTSTTPRRLNEAGPWWNLARAERTPQPPGVHEVLDVPADPADTLAGVAQCRAALRGAVA